MGRDDSAHPMGPPRRPNEVVGVGRRRHSGGNELSRLRGSERSAAWADDVGATCGRPLDVGGFFRGARRLGAPYHLLTIHRGLPPWDAPTRRAPHFFPKKWGERRAGGLRPPWTPQYGGSWRRWAVQTGQRPAAHCRLFSWHSCHRRCRASGGTHRDYPASPDGRCAVPAWPAGPPLVPCRRNTMVFAAAACGAGERGLVRPSPAPSFQKSPGSAPQLRRAPLMLPRPASGWPGGPSVPG